MYLKYIKLVILNTFFILGLCNFSFSFKIVTLPLPHPQQYNLPYHQNKISDLLPANTFLKFSISPRLEGGACHDASWKIRHIVPKKWIQYQNFLKDTLVTKHFKSEPQHLICHVIQRLLVLLFIYFSGGGGCS